VALALVVGAVIGLFALLPIQRDLTTLMSGGRCGNRCSPPDQRPIAAGVFGGVTASTDFLVAAFRQAGLDVQAATTGQGLISDPIDKVTTFFTVYLILGALATRFKARSRRVSGAGGGISPTDTGPGCRRSSGGPPRRPPPPQPRQARRWRQSTALAIGWAGSGARVWSRWPCCAGRGRSHPRRCCAPPCC
jgi:hypothetical protein